MKKTIYKLEVEKIGEALSVQLMSKGHHPDMQFLIAAQEYWGGPLSAFKLPRHGWYRCIPGPTGKYISRYHEAMPNSRGAFPVTYIGY